MSDHSPEEMLALAYEITARGWTLDELLMFSEHQLQLAEERFAADKSSVNKFRADHAAGVVHGIRQAMDVLAGRDPSVVMKPR